MTPSAFRARLVRGTALVIWLASTASGQIPTGWPDGLSRVTRATLQRLADSASALDAPAEPLYAKAAEGVLKGAPEGRIEDAVRALTRELIEARAVLGTEASTAEIVAGAGALHARAPQDALRRLHQAQLRAPRRVSLAAPLVVLADILTRRAPLEAISSALEKCVARGARAEDFMELRAAVEREIKQGQAPARAVSEQAQVVIRRLEVAPARQP
jgi:hypothetical protein